MKVKLSDFAIEALKRAARGPFPAQETNPGVKNKLVTAGLATCVMLPTPYKSRKGDVSHLQITEAGRERLRHEGADA